MGRNALLAALLAAGCAAPRAGSTGEEPPPPPPAGVPAILEGLPPAVVLDRALFELESGSPERAAAARSTLVALEERAAGPALRARAAAAPPDSEERLELLAVLAERGDPLAGVGAEERVALVLREAERDARGGRGTLLALDRIRRMGQEGIRILRAEALPSRPRAATASRILEAFAEYDAVRALRSGPP
jgi:hypothetical protein